MTKRRKRMDENYAGNGVLLCQICGEPVRDHSIGRCPEADTDPGLFKSSANRPGRRSKHDTPTR